MKEVLGIIAMVIGVVGFIYGMYWLMKTGSYFFFYEGMVQETIREMVKSGALIDGGS